MEKGVFKEVLTRGLEEMGLSFKDEQVEKLWLYLQLLQSENQKYNLTAIEEEKEVISKHFLDSLALSQLQGLEELEDKRIIDVGTGAGFPGLVLKIFCPSLDLVLLDSLLKRVKFLRFLAGKLQLEKLEIIHGRAEEYGQREAYREGFDLGISRAVAPLNTLLEYTLPFLKEGGSLLLYKGPDYPREVAEAARALKLLGGNFLGAEKVQIPGLEGERYLLKIEKVQKTPPLYPRRPGIPKKRPL